MFTHRVKIQLIPNSFINLSRKIQDEIMPALRLEKGFYSGTTSIDTFWLIATEDSLWKTKEDAETYHQTGYRKVLKMLSGVIVGEPVTSIFESSEPALNQRKITSKIL